MSIKSVSIIGRGDFGELLTRLMPKDVTCQSYGSKDTVTNLESIGASDIVILSVPLAAYDQVLGDLALYLKPNTLLIDVCSVKVIPAQKIHHHLPDHKNLLITHPLFGPQSYDNGQKHVLVITEANGSTAKEVETYCRDKLNLKILHMTNEEHDQRMAEIHALTFFIARGLGQMKLDDEPFMTPSFQALLDLAKLDQSHTEALFQTIQNGNPFAAHERQKFLDKLAVIDQQLS